jgi:hypothetical protein
VSAPDAPQFDEARIVQVLDRHGVAYVLVGGLGALLHGASRPTMDFDLCAAWDLDNLGRLVDALRELGAELRVRPGVQPPTVDAHLLHDSVVTTWRTTAGDIDVLVGIPSSPQAGLNRFDPSAAGPRPASSPAARSTWLRSRTSSPPNALQTTRPTAKRSPNLRLLPTSRRPAPNLSGHSRLAGNPRDPIRSPRPPQARATFRSDRFREV